VEHTAALFRPRVKETLQSLAACAEMRAKDRTAAEGQARGVAQFRKRQRGV